MRVNKTFSHLQPYIFDHLNRKAREQGPDVIQLVTGNPDLPTPRRIGEAVARAAQDYHPDPPLIGLPELREAVADYYHARFGIELSPEHVIIGHGTKSDLWDFTRLFSSFGDSVVVPDPSYPIVRESVLLDGRSVVPVPFREGTLDLNGKALGDSAIVYLANPNNPDGRVIDKQRLGILADVAEQRDITVLSDIVYADITLLADKKSPSFLQTGSFAGVELGGFKVYSMTGFRVSWFVTLNDDIASCWKRYKCNRDKGTPVYTQAAALTALTDQAVADEVAAHLAEYRARASMLKQGLEDAGFQVHGLNHTPFAWIRTPEEYTSWEFVDLLLAEKSVLAIPGSAFGQEGEGFFRASIFQPRALLEEAIDRISSFVRRI